MRKSCLTLFYTLFFLFYFNNAQTQPIPEIEANGKTYSQIFDSLSTGLIPGRIPYGVLMDRVYGWSSLKHFTITNNNHK